MTVALAPIPTVAQRRYRAYGLAITSALPLPELAISSAQHERPAEVALELGPVAWAPPGGTHDDGFICGDEQEAFIYVEDVATFQIQQGRRILIDPAPGVSEGRLRVFALGGALGLLLHQRGLLVLHASAVRVAEGAVAFLGHSGAGKSTMAGALHQAGHAVLADDMVALDLSGPRPLLLPGFARLKLWPVSAARLGYNLDALGEFDAEDERRECRAAGDDDQASLPIHGLYLLEAGRTTLIERLAPQDAFRLLLDNSYAAGLLGRSGATVSHFRQSASVAAQVPAFRLHRRRAISSLPALARRVIEHATLQAQGEARL